MTDRQYAPQPLARWYTAAAIASLIFMLLGCVAVVIHLTTNPAELPLDQRALLEAEPKWVLAASAIGFLAGAYGALLLVRRRRGAEVMLLVSLIALAVWFAGCLLAPDFRDLLSTRQIAVLLAVLAIAWTIYWFGRHSRQRGWLR